MVEKITKYKVGEQTFDKEEDAVLYESETNIISLMHADGFPIVLPIVSRLQESKDLWEAMTAYCAALEYVHNPPKSFRSLFEPGEVSGSFDNIHEDHVTDKAVEEDFHAKAKRALFGQPPPGSGKSFTHEEPDGIGGPELVPTSIRSKIEEENFYINDPD